RLSVCRGGRLGGALVGPLLTEEQRGVAASAEGVEAVEHRRPPQPAGAVLFEELDERRRARQVGVLAAVPPEGRVAVGVEAVMDGDEVADAFPRAFVKPVVLADLRGTD